jgi:hypothetical protein
MTANGFVNCMIYRILIGLPTGQDASAILIATVARHIADLNQQIARLAMYGGMIRLV